jgi:TPR repeat protein
LQKGIAAGATEMGRMWLWKATGKGNGEAPVLLAEMYAQGKGVTQDCEQAMLLLNAAAKKANPHARSTLANMYAAGQCVPKDRVEAYKWLHAALQANPGSDFIEKNQQTLWNQMTAAERQRASAYR